jgi:hypothetical protein
MYGHGHLSRVVSLRNRKANKHSACNAMVAQLKIAVFYLFIYYFFYLFIYYYFYLFIYLLLFLFIYLLLFLFIYLFIFCKSS